MYSKPCLICGKPITEKYYSWIKNRKYCSKKCSGQAVSNKITKKCIVCGKEIIRRASGFNNGRGKFCSKECQYNSIIGENNPIHSSEVRTKHRENTIKAMAKIKDKISGPNHPNWQGGKSFEPYCPQFNSDFKNRVRIFWGCKCGVCGKPQTKQKRLLSVHHVNYDKKVCCTAKVPLFIPLCMSCHAKTNYNRDYWEKILTEYIMKYYDGESYEPKSNCQSKPNQL